LELNGIPELEFCPPGGGMPRLEFAKLFIPWALLKLPPEDMASPVIIPG